MKPIIGISMGDPAGIGPEICVKAASDPYVLSLCNPVIAGSASVIERAAGVVRSSALVVPIHNINDALFMDNKINVFDLKQDYKASDSFGVVSAEAGHAAFEAVTTVIDLASRGLVDATVTAPIHKESINMAGHHFAGHTEIFAKYTGSSSVAMLLVDGDFRVIHVSTHVSLRKACDLVKKDRVLHVIRLMHDACRQFGIPNPYIAVCGLNPHASDGGLFGTEEAEEIMPAIEAARQEGINAEGPHPADTIFSKVAGGFYDGCVAMYHDQGHVPFKVKGFVWDQQQGKWSKIHGVNITLGIPIIRVSVDHGTAFDIAGKGIADHTSMIHAIEYAVRMSKYKTGSQITDAGGSTT
ncbi:MAG: 4-hydroxythreonine-4-phosphate dehydrogenase PdxA [Cyclonatronaceae bacterium]